MERSLNLSNLKASFGRHETFALRYSWLTKGFQTFTKNPEIFSSDEATIDLGVGKNRVNAIKYWLRATSMLDDTAVINSGLSLIIFELFKVFTVENLQIKILTFKKPSDYDHEKNLFLTQYKNLKIEEKTTKDFHDRFIIFDKKDTFHIGASIKDAGKSVFMINKIEDIGICSAIIDSFNKRWI